MQIKTNEFILESLSEAISEFKAGRRKHSRFSFFRRVTIADEIAQGPGHSLFCREISGSGIGLLHNFPLETDQVCLNIPTIGEHQVDVTIQVHWCQFCGDGWYTSGGRFTNLSVSQVMSLLLPTVLSETDRRLNHRFPFFKPLTIAIGSGEHKETFSAFSKDISESGIGLLHNRPLELQNVILTIPNKSNSSFDIPTKIVHCRPCGGGWYWSGGIFRRLMLERLEDRLL